MNEPTISEAAVVVLVAGIVVYVLRRTGHLSWRALDDAPPRTGNLGIEDILGTIGLVIVSMVLTGFFAHLLMPEKLELTGARLHLWLALMTQVAVLPVLLIVFVRVHDMMDDGIAGLGLGLHCLKRGVVWGVLGWLAMMPLVGLAGLFVQVVCGLFEIEMPEIAHETLTAMLEADPQTRWGLIAIVTIVAPLFEEIINRGLLQTALQQSGLIRNRWLAIVVTSIIFAAMHLGAVPPPAVVPLFVLSLGLGYVYERTGSLWAPIVLHALFNSTSVALLFAGYAE